jgi:phosphatidylinositol-4,5-bisphosphate 4-phosphatase
MTSIGGPKLARKWAIVFLILSTMFIALAAGVAYGAIYVEQTSKGVMYAGYIGLFLVAMILLVRSIFYWTMKVSEKQGSA